MMPFMKHNNQRSGSRLFINCDINFKEIEFYNFSVSILVTEF